MANDIWNSIRERVSGNLDKLKEREKYFNRLKELREKYDSPKERMSVLWEEFECTYYCCPQAEAGEWVDRIGTVKEILEAIEKEE